MPEDSQQISPQVMFLSQLERLQSEAPDKFKETVTNISESLKEAAAEATESGDTEKAGQLTALAEKFAAAAKGGDLPSAEDLEGVRPEDMGLPPGPPPPPPRSTSSTDASSAGTDLLSLLQSSGLSSDQIASLMSVLRSPETSSSSSS